MDLFIEIPHKKSLRKILPAYKFPLTLEFCCPKTDQAMKNKDAKTFSPQQIRLLSADMSKLNALPIRGLRFRRRFSWASITQKIIGWVVIHRD
jgi:hypothetical protein